MIKRPPAFGTKIKSVDAAEAKAMPGIIDVVTFKNNVAIVGKSTWDVMKARAFVKVEYEKDGDIESTADHDKILADLLTSDTLLVTPITMIEMAMVTTTRRRGQVIVSWTMQIRRMRG